MTNIKRTRGRPKAGAAVPIHLRVSDAIAEASDDYRHQCLPLGNRQDAVRELVRLQLAEAGLLSVPK